MKIIFLDIDGVIKEDRQHTPFLDGSLALLKVIADRTGAVLVMSSSWKTKYRDFIDSGLHTEYEDISALYSALCGHGLRIYDYTPYAETEKALRRPAEIREYLRSRDDIESFCILDDRDEFEWAELYGNLVLTYISTDADGVKTAHLTEEKAEAAVDILNKTE